jgi:hypothetical protein
MSLDTHVKPVRLQRSELGDAPPENAVFVGPGSKWNNPFRKRDTDPLRGEADVEAALRWPRLFGQIFRFDK